jgi:uncharacterized protein (TIGR03084 family)
MTLSMGALVDDLLAESADLRALVADLDEPSWATPTPAAGWSVRDQLTHLAYFDTTAVQSALDPETFLAELERWAVKGGLDPDAIAAAHRGMPGAEVLAWFDQARASFAAAYRPLDPGLRVPWYGPAMSAASSVTARIMETWAHGQDVADALGATRVPSARLRHVAHIGVRTLPFSYGLHGRAVPVEPIHVALTAPDGDRWTWGPPDADERVVGRALDFCLVTTQRRHIADTGLVVTGSVAADWVSIAQAYAGRAGAGRVPGQFG